MKHVNFPLNKFHKGMGQFILEKFKYPDQHQLIDMHKTKDRVTQTPLKTRSELGCSGRVSNSCSTSGTCCVYLVTNPVISHE
jgi:hypothetical protein